LSKFFFKFVSDNRAVGYWVFSWPKLGSFVAVALHKAVLYCIYLSILQKSILACLVFFWSILFAFLFMINHLLHSVINVNGQKGFKDRKTIPLGFWPPLISIFLTWIISLSVPSWTVLKPKKQSCFENFSRILVWIAVLETTNGYMMFKISFLQPIQNPITGCFGQCIWFFNGAICAIYIFN
jgi:hypothetical protein